jgi:hypothetical protein
MKISKKNKLSKVSANGASILERYRQLKGERPASGLSQKIMEITRAGESIAYPQDGCILNEVCVLCDSSDVCDTCDANDFICVFTDDTGWCIFTDALDWKDLPPWV